MSIIWAGQKLSLLEVDTMIHLSYGKFFLFSLKFPNQAELNFALQVDFKYYAL